MGIGSFIFGLSFASLLAESSGKSDFCEFATLKEAEEFGWGSQENNKTEEGGLRNKQG